MFFSCDKFGLAADIEGGQEYEKKSENSGFSSLTKSGLFRVSNKGTSKKLRL